MPISGLPGFVTRLRPIVPAARSIGAPRQSFLFVATIIFVSCRQVYRPID
jgi:hypothetical protein